MTYTITKNADFNSLEIAFDGKPSEAIRDVLKAMRFRWHGVKKVWYGYKTEEEVRAALGEKPEQSKAAKAETVQSATKQDHVRIYYNGIKIDGGELIRCFYSLDNNTTGKKSVSISARDYAHLPADLFEVHNKTDIYTDYFDNDRAYLTEEHPLFKYFYYAGMKESARSAKKHIEYLEKCLSERERWPGQHEYYRDQIAEDKKRIEKFNNTEDPGQPTQEDLNKINMMWQEKENARIAAEHEAEIKERERIACKRGNGLHLIHEETEKHPIKEGEPIVLINWSEHVALGEFADNTLKLSVTAAEHILSAFDKEVNQEGRGYDKTRFTITGTDETGEQFSYDGRYDLGDNDGGLIQHIRGIGEWDLTHEYNGAIKANPDETNDRIKFADYLAQFVENPA